MSYIEKIRGKNGKIRSIGQDEFIPRVDLLGRKIGRLTIISFAYKRKRTYCYNCVCDCGKTCIKNSHYLISENKNPHKSCGCWHREIHIQVSTKHKLTKTPEYKSWQELIGRCTNLNNKAWSNYGGRGIKVCDRWLGENGFVNFLNDMGERPSPKHSIDRIDVNGNYEPSNCRWATVKEQCNNRRTNIKITYNNETKTLSEWCEFYNMNYNNVRFAYHKGKSFEYIISKYSR